MRVKFTLQYGCRLSMQQVQALADITGSEIKVDTEAGPDENGGWKITGWETYDADIEDVLAAIPATLVQLSDLAEASPFRDMVRELRALSARIDLFGAHKASSGSYNELVNVHVPGNALMSVAQVRVLEDCCTEWLDEKLNQGWRILAVSPQPDQRRPDYIVGHVDRDANIEANR